MLIVNWRRAIVSFIVTVGFLFSVAFSVQAQGEPLSLNTEAVLLDAEWSPDGQLLAVAGDWGIRFFTSDLQELAALALPDDEINSINWRPDGLQIAGGLNDGTVRIWDKAPSGNTFTLNTVLSTDHQWVSYVSWSPNSDFLAVLANDFPEGSLEPLVYGDIWDTSLWTVVAELPGPLVPPVGRLTWSPNSGYIGGGGTTNSITDRCALCEPGRNYNIVYIADSTTGQTVQVIPGLPAEVGGDLSWNSENELAIAYYGLMVYDASSGQALPTSNERVAQNKYFSRIAWGPDGNLIAGANLATVDIVDSSTGTILVNLASEFDSIEALAWNPDGNSLVIIDQGGLISSYDVSLYIGSLFPHALAGNDRTIVDNDHTSSETLVLDGSSSFDFDGTIVSYSWTENDVEIATGATPTVELAVGVHTIRLTITDDDGLTASEEIVITVESPILSVSEG